MRRRDRELSEPAQIRDIIDCCKVCRLGFYDKGEVYIIPLNFGYAFEDESYVLYFHGAAEGRKFDLAGATPEVGFEMDTDFQINEGENACSFSARFRSLVGTGQLSVVEEREEKLRGLGLIMKHMTGREEWIFDESALAKTAVFRLDVKSLSGKEHK